MAHKMMPVQLHKKHWKHPRKKKTIGLSGDKPNKTQIMNDFLRQKKGR